MLAARHQLKRRAQQRSCRRKKRCRSCALIAADSLPIVPSRSRLRAKNTVKRRLSTLNGLHAVIHAPRALRSCERAYPFIHSFIISYGQDSTICHDVITKTVSFYPKINANMQLGGYRLSMTLQY